MSSWRCYPKVYNLGHSAVADLFKDSVTVEEKVDGSQFSFGMFSGELKISSKNQQMFIGMPPGMFKNGIDSVLSIKDKLHDGWTYRGEYLSKPKHNTLAYDRVPNQNVVIFDINIGEETYLSYEEKKIEAERLGFECIPLLAQGIFTNLEQLTKLLELTSFLGGNKIEGFVIKNYSRFGVDGKALMGKYVSEAFKEMHHGEWKNSNPSGKDFIGSLGECYRTPARWEKAVQHLRDNGTLQNSPQDIGPLMKEVSKDILAECRDEIKEKLFSFAWKKIARIAIAGLPEWYKKKLLEKQFEPTEGVK